MNRRNTKLGTTVGAIVLMVGLGWGIQWLKTSVNLRTLFPAESRILQDYAWIEKQVAPMVPIEVVAGFKKNCPLSSADRFNLIGRIQDVLDQTEPIKGTVSVANMMPNLPADTDRLGRNIAICWQQFWSKLDPISRLPIICMNLISSSYGELPHTLAHWTRSTMGKSWRQFANNSQPAQPINRPQVFRFG